MLTLKFFNEVGQTNIFINRVKFGFLSFQFYYYYDWGMQVDLFLLFRNKKKDKTY